MSEFTPQACPHCTHPTTPDNVFLVAGGLAYHVLCYQDAMLAAGQPDPFPKCDNCEGIIWQFNEAGDLDIVIRGLKCVHDEKTGENEWVAGRWHPECAPPEAPVGDADDDEDEPEVEPAPAVEADPEAELPESPPDEVRGPTPAPLHTGPQKVVNGKPVCPRCDSTIHRQPYPLNGLLYHRSCGARERSKLNPNPKRVGTRKLPRCAVCAKAVKNDKYRVVCDTETGEEFYHRSCYRSACIAGGLDDPYPDDPEAAVARMNEGKERKKRERAEATVVCGICDQKVLRTAYVDHVGPCAEAARAANVAAGESDGE